jgi:hypothetical protein
VWTVAVITAVIIGEVWNAIDWTSAVAFTPSSREIAVFFAVGGVVVWLAGSVLLLFLGGWLENVLERRRYRDPPSTDGRDDNVAR